MTTLDPIRWWLQKEPAERSAVLTAVREKALGRLDKALLVIQSEWDRTAEFWQAVSEGREQRKLSGMLETRLRFGCKSYCVRASSREQLAQIASGFEATLGIS